MIKGIVTPIVTPIDNKSGKINYKCLDLLIDHLISNGVHGVFPFGTTGEFYEFNDEEYSDVLNYIVKKVDKRVLVFAGCNSISTHKTIDVVKIAEQTGVDAVSILTPMFISQTNEEIYNYYYKIANSTKMDIVMYNNKPKTNVTISPSVVRELANINNIIGIKDSTGDMTNTLEYIRMTKDVKDFSVLVGRDTLIYSGLCAGAAGAISSCSNIAPKVVVDIYNYFINGNYVKSLESQFRLAPLRLACNMGTFPQVIKEGLQIIGIDVGDCMSPILKLTASEHMKLVDVIKEMQL